MPSTLLLKVTDFKGSQHWRWELTSDQGKYLRDYEVNLDPKDANYQAFVNLDRYLLTHSDPEHRIEDQTRIMNEVGDWVGMNVFGDVGEYLAKLKASSTVRVQVPSNARGLLYLPLEMARIRGKPLVLSNARLVFELADREPLMDKAPIGEKLRILAVFSLPTDASALALRRERYELIKFINEIAQNKGLAIDLKVLQYGVTRDDLEKILKEGKGWDLVHFSGHGERAILVLEKSDGTADLISSKALAELLAPATERLKLVTLSSCLSAAATIEETMRQLKLWKPGAVSEAKGSEPSEAGGIPALAWELEKNLDCAVLAMRYSVGDEFAIGLASELYKLLLDEGQPLAEALKMAMKSTLKGDYSASIPPISLATPNLCGGLAADLFIEPPRVVGGFQKPYASLAGFPDETEHFVGRAGPLGRACAALAPASKKRAVLFHGMAGAGKTACALEVAYHYYRCQTRFQWFVWYSAPRAGEDISGALRNFALAMENKLKGLNMVNVIDNAAEFESWLPTLSEYLSHNSILIVLDNIENLLTSDGGWRDKRWGSLIKALLGHKGQSRLVITSRRVPGDIDEKMVCRIPIHALSLNESLLLARELPNLGRLLAGKSSIGPEKGRELVFRTLKLVQGHPKLIEFAEGQAADPEALERYLKEAAGSWGDDEGGLQKFFEEGESAKDAEEFMKVLKGWTQGVSGSLPDAPRMLFEVLCALEGDDRMEWIVKQVWPGIWEKLGREGPAPEVEPALGVLQAAGLVDVRSTEGDVEYTVQPGPAEAGLDEVPRLLFSVLSSVEGGSRRSMLEQVWPLIWERLGLEGAAAEVEPILDALKAAGLVVARDIEGQSSYSIHPGVAEAGLGESGEDLRSAVDSVMADFWRSLFHQARSDEVQGLGRLVLRSCLSSAPYLMRQKRWHEAAGLLENVIHRDHSPRTVAAVLPMLKHIAETTKGMDGEIADSIVLAKALLASGQLQEAEDIFRSRIQRCEAGEEFGSA